VAAAVNDAATRISQKMQESMSGLTAGLGLPPGLKLPF
jgi:DNA-binding protein YbaB